ncbi:MAG: hypothetical protein QOI74_911 [Micromonosporaceae bacterium]|nr:hypothetical protein [Micromonosporaceae bacterium]
MPRSLAEGLATAAVLQEQWRFAAARDELTAALALVAESTDRLAAITGRRMFAEVLRELGEIDEAYEIVGPVVAECERRLGDGHPATARATTVLATLLHARGELDAAVEVYGRVLDGRFAETGPAGRAVRLARAHLALVYRDRGDIGAARLALDTAYKVLRRAYGITDVDAIRFGVDLAALCHQDGDLLAARRLLAVARAGCQVRLEPWHPLSTLVDRELSAVEPAMPGKPVDPGPGRITPDEWAERARRAPRVPPGPAYRPPAAPVPVPAVPVQRLPPPGAPGTAPAVRERPPAGVATVRPPRRRVRVALAVGGFLSVAAIVVVALVATGSGRDGDRPGPTTATGGPAPPPGAGPAGTGREPLRVRLRDAGASLVVDWQPPAGGPAPVVVALATDDRPATVVATVPAGTTEYTLPVGAGGRYCVIVAAVYPGETESAATSVCTRRAASAG